MTKQRSRRLTSHSFRDKLVLNQWLISLFGVAPPWESNQGSGGGHPYRVFVERFKNTREGLNEDNLHFFFHELKNTNTFPSGNSSLDVGQILTYEENIVRHTAKVNANRHQPVMWKYFQWLSLLFVEIYLDRYFGDRKQLLHALNSYLKQFNAKSVGFTDLPLYVDDDLNKLCFQNATGSGKTPWIPL